jgi:hypothetical protein
MAAGSKTVGKSILVAVSAVPYVCIAMCVCISITVKGLEMRYDLGGEA